MSSIMREALWSFWVISLMRLITASASALPSIPPPHHARACATTTKRPLSGSSTHMQMSRPDTPRDGAGTDAVRVRKDEAASRKSL